MVLLFLAPQQCRIMIDHFLHASRRFHSDVIDHDVYHQEHSSGVECVRECEEVTLVPESRVEKCSILDPESVVGRTVSGRRVDILYKFDSIRQ